MEISLTKKLERKKKEQIGKGPFSISSIELVVVNLYTKFEVSILNSCGDIFEDKSGEKEKRTNARKNK